MKNLKKLLIENGINFCPEDEIKGRIEKLTLFMQQKNISTAIIFSKVNNFYFTGTNQEQILVVYADKPPILFVKRDVGRAYIESSIKIIEINSFKDLKKYIYAEKIGIEYNYITATQFLKLKSFFNVEFIDITPAIFNIRSIKSDYELNLMGKAGSIANKVYVEALNFLKEGLTEIEFGSIMFSLAQKYGHEGVLRTGSIDFAPVSWHILSGISGTVHGQYDAPASGIGLSPAFPNSASRKKIKKHEPIMVDFGICYYGYQVDVTRMYCIGEPGEKFVLYYEKAKEIEKYILSNLRENVSANAIFDISIEKAKNLNVYNEFLGIGKNKKRFIGHGVGLETSEIPLVAKNSKHTITDRMTIAIEPKFVVPGFGIIGIENTIVLNSGTCQKLTTIPETILNTQ
jgi:Xaa-Pro aminopeptidase